MRGWMEGGADLTKEIPDVGSKLLTRLHLKSFHTNAAVAAELNCAPCDMCQLDP